MPTDPIPNNQTESIEREIAWRRGMDFGVGIDSPSGAAMGVAATGPATDIPGFTGEILDYSLVIISTEEELQSALKISASAGGGVGLFNASARMDYARNCQVNSSSVFALVKVEVSEAFQSMKAPGVDPAAAALLANGDVQRFREEYGDSFVRGIQAGGVFFGMIEISTRDESEKELINVAVQGSYSGFSASGQFSKDFQDVVKSRGVKVTCHIEGGTLPSPLPTAVDSLIAAAGAWVRTVKGNAVPYSVLIDSYKILPLPSPPNYIDLQHQLDVLSRCAIWRNMDLQTLSDIAYIKSNPEQFTDLNLDDLTQKEKLIAADLNTIAVAASNAVNRPTQAALPLLQVPPPLPLPSRIRKLILQEPVILPNVVGMDKDSASKSVVQSGLVASFNSAPPVSTRFTGVNVWYLTAQSGHVWSQAPAGGASASKGSVVTLYIKI